MIGKSGMLGASMKNTWVDIDLRTLVENTRRTLSELRPETSLICVVKANAYGHGMIPVARTVAQHGVHWFAVAHLHEALQLRRAVDDNINILILGVVEPDDVPVILEKKLVPLVVSEDQGQALAAAAARLGQKMKVHLKIDTGMGRLGVPWEEAAAIFGRLSQLPGLEIHGVCTHFASVELKKPSLGATQAARFLEAAAQMKGRLFRHVSSSRATQYHHDWDLDGVRPGIILYGYGAGEKDMRIRTRPILQWKTRVMQVKKVPANFPVGYYSTYTTAAPTTIATLGVGYADGYHRALSSKGFVLIRGQRCPVVGRISMNWITVDAGSVPDARVGDEAVLIGEQGGEAIWADELARLARTIAYEILTSINPTIDRNYLG